MSVAESYKTLSNTIKAKLSQTTALPGGHSSDTFSEAGLGVSLIYLAYKVTADEPEINIAASLEALDRGIKEHYFEQPGSRGLLYGDYFYAKGLIGICENGSLSDIKIVSTALADISAAFSSGPIKTPEALWHAASLWRAAALMSDVPGALYVNLSRILGAERTAKQLKLKESILKDIARDKDVLLNSPQITAFPGAWQAYWKNEAPE